jgi:general secretion pathway protein F
VPRRLDHGRRDFPRGRELVATDMPQFSYRALTQAGDMVVGRVEAPSREEVIRRIEYLGHLPIDAQAATEGILRRGFAVKAPRSRDVTIFLRQLALLVEAGLTLEAALQTLGDDANKSVVRFAEALRSSISAGHSFAEALESHPSIIEPAYVAMVRAGETSGKLEGALNAIVEDRTRRDLLAERINSAIRYPLFLIVTAVLILLFFLTYVVPQFEVVFKDLGNRLNAGAAFVLAASTWLHANFDLFLGSCLVVVLGFWLVLYKRERRARLLGILGMIPGIAGPMRDRRTARVVGTLGLLVANGVALPTALKILRDVVSEPRAIAAVDKLHDQVRNGRRFADALAETDLLPPLAIRMLRVGDETGDLPSIARHAAQFYEHKLGLGLDRLMGAVGPATIILVSIVIGALIISIMSALLSITELAL